MTLQQQDVFELHLTTHPLHPEQVQGFTWLCRQLGVKPLVIELQPGLPIQPMTCSRVQGTLAVPDCEIHLIFEHSEIIWAETPFPGLRVFLKGTLPDQGAQTFQIDFAFGDPLVHPPVDVHVEGVGAVLSCLPEILVAWKLHGLTEFGRGRWRAKDLYDLAVLSELNLNLQVLQAALPVAFTSRGDDPANLQDFCTRENWGCSTSGQRKWRSFLKKHQLQQNFLDARHKVRGVLKKMGLDHA
ncbi:nucleotidyl transferase AbiEii/AbiGii toxin family protein [Deinococcus roseus]|uniref:nucleotidyl transferase AbiEii/AbiGii toxin family protein n=1 Tax=Deinococcus roseus TaxID=392414 RepID=UPI0016698FCE|nr:nucleotidyl transferase AbiEii/AbiGii toxin family protein [Deinococcus roseus]